MSDLAIQIHKFVLANKYGDEDFSNFDDVSEAFPTHSEMQIKKALHELANAGYIDSVAKAEGCDYYVFHVLG